MRFVILGSSPGMPTENKHLSSIYVETQGKKILFDCGDGTFKRLMEHGLSGNEIDAIVISHYHPDHICGVYMVLQMLYLEGRTKALSLYLPERPSAFLDSLHMFYTFEQKFRYELKVMLVSDVELNYPMISPALNDHLSGYEPIIKALKLPNTMQSYSFRIEGENGALVYTSDIQNTALIEPLLHDCHTVIIDAIHPEAYSVIKLEQYPIKRILLNHGISPELANWLQENPNSRFDFTLEDVEYSI